MTEELKQAIKEIAYLQAKYYHASTQDKEEWVKHTFLGKADGLRRALAAIESKMFPSVEGREEVRMAINEGYDWFNKQSEGEEKSEQQP
jgi:hypothetical protein